MTPSAALRALADSLADGRASLKAAVKRLREIAADVSALEFRAAPVNLDRIDEQLAALSCGDNSCSMARPRGMATNGGCRCVDKDDPARLRAVRSALQLRMRQVEELKRQIREADVMRNASPECLRQFIDGWLRIGIAGGDLSIIAHGGVNRMADVLAEDICGTFAVMRRSNSVST